MRGMETRVTYRTSEETVKRLQELSDKYGVSQSALLTLLVNERWLAENASREEYASQRLAQQSVPESELVAAVKKALA